jgi:hypothetical protein
MLVWLTKIVLLLFEMVGSLFTGGGGGEIIQINKNLLIYFHFGIIQINIS